MEKPRQNDKTIKTVKDGKRTNGWTPERRARQAEKIRAWRPWTRSTGPRTDEGKARSCLNAQKHGMRGRAVRILLHWMGQQRRYRQACDAFARGRADRIHFRPQPPPSYLIGAQNIAKVPPAPFPDGG